MILVVWAGFVPLSAVCRALGRLIKEARIVMEDGQYKSPVRKLLRFFERSRDGWKRKCKEAKVTVKRLANRVRSLEKSRDQWKERVARQREELGRLRQELEKQKHATC